MTPESSSAGLCFSVQYFKSIYVMSYGSLVSTHVFGTFFSMDPWSHLYLRVFLVLRRRIDAYAVLIVI